MDSGLGVARQELACKLVVRKEQNLIEVQQFVIAGLEVGQQVVALAAPRFLKELALGVSDSGMKPDALLRNGRLIFLAAPDCIAYISKSKDPFTRGPLRPNGSLLRWVTDWSWAYRNGSRHDHILDLQHRVHDLVRSLTTLSLCSLLCENVERAALLAILADHRQAAKAKLEKALAHHAAST